MPKLRVGADWGMCLLHDNIQSNKRRPIIMSYVRKFGVILDRN
jgi:hypothetical protein